MASVFDVAEWFLSKESMTHKKVQKLCYYYKAWGYALYDEDLIPGYDFEAWIHGPVSPELYQKYKGSYWMDLKQTDDNSHLFSDKELWLLNSVWDTYGDLSPNEIEARSHMDMPWKNARKGYKANENCTVKISIDDMKTYYKSIYAGD